MGTSRTRAGEVPAVVGGNAVGRCFEIVSRSLSAIADLPQVGPY
jgi:hypothetical protein